MGDVRPVLKVVEGKAPAGGKTPLEAAYEHFRPGLKRIAQTRCGSTS